VQLLLDPGSDDAYDALVPITIEKRHRGARCRLASQLAGSLCELV
jgi:hypothetical protein